MQHTKSKLSTFLFCLFVICYGQAQNREYVRNKMFWSEIVLTGKIKGKFSYQLDYQYRRSADADNVEGGDHDNLFKNAFQQVVRPWVHYQAMDALRLSISPIGFWGTWAETANSLYVLPENRITLQATLNQKLGRVTLTHRYRYEFRFIGTKMSTENTWDIYHDQEFSGSDIKKGRLRYFLRALVPLNHSTITPKTFYIDTYNEIFLNMGKQVANTNLLDQNRLFIGLGYRFGQDIRVEAGYLNQTVFRFNNVQQNNIDQNDILQVLVFFDDFNRFFKKRKPVEVK